MKRNMIAILALAMVPGIALAQGGTGTGGTGGGGGTGAGTGGAGGTGGGAGAAVGDAATPPRTREQARQDSAAAQKRAQQQAGQDTSQQAGGQQGQTGQTGNQQAQSTQGQDTVTQSSSGNVSSTGRSGRSGMRLSSDQVQQLQTALSGAGCEVGTVDGVMGPKTRSAIECAKKKNNVTSTRELYRSLNLNFAGGGGTGGAMRDTSGTNPAAQNDSSNPAKQAVHGDSAQTGGSNQGRIYPPHDSTQGKSGSDTSSSGRSTSGMHDSSATKQPPR